MWLGLRNNRGHCWNKPVFDCLLAMENDQQSSVLSLMFCWPIHPIFSLCGICRSTITSWYLLLAPTSIIIMSARGLCHLYVNKCHFGALAEITDVVFFSTYDENIKNSTLLNIKQVVSKNFVTSCETKPSLVGAHCHTCLRC